MERMQKELERASQSSREFRSFLGRIQEMSAEEKQKARIVVGVLENDLISSADTGEARRRSSLWHGLVELLTMGLDPSLQLLAHQSTGPDVARDVVLARIADIKQALM